MRPPFIGQLPKNNSYHILYILCLSNKGGGDRQVPKPGLGKKTADDLIRLPCFNYACLGEKLQLFHNISAGLHQFGADLKQLIRAGP